MKTSATLAMVSILLLVTLATGLYINKNGMGNKIQAMTTACQASYKANASTEVINKNGTTTDKNQPLADKCGQDIKTVEQGNHWEVIGNGQGNVWAEYKG